MLYGGEEDYSKGADAPFRWVPTAEGVCIYQFVGQPVMKRFVKCFFELLTQALVSAAGNGQEKGRKIRLWTVRSRFRG